jgi:hypothetical protein
MTSCCKVMELHSRHRCQEHADHFACPDVLVHRTQAGGAHGLIIHDGGESMIRIRFCPWCGTDLDGIKSKKAKPRSAVTRRRGKAS